jgi:hypothetical protein
MSNHFTVPEIVQIIRHTVGRDAMPCAEEIPNRIVVRRAGENLHAIAGGEDHGFGDALIASEGSQGFAQAFGIEGQSLPDLDRSCLVVETDQCQLHDLTHSFTE